MPTLTAALRPWAPHLHPGTWAVLVAGAVAVGLGHRRLHHRAAHPVPWTGGERARFAVALGVSGLALGWPLADLAAHWSLTALVTQRVLLVLAVAPLLLLGLPYDVVQWLTRPAPVDALLTRLARPVTAVVVVTVVAVASMAPPLVAAQAASPWARAALDVAAVAAGLVLWLPVLGRVPGLVRPRPVARVGYLVVQAVVPAFLSFVYILAARPFYPAFAGAHAAIGLRALNDQQVAGFVSKLGFLAVLLPAAAVVLSRTRESDERFGPDDPLVWADVERHFERLDRQGARDPGSGDPTGTVPPPGGAPPPEPGDDGPARRTDAP